MDADGAENEPGSVTGWYLAFRGGDQASAARLFDRFFDRMVRQAGRQLGPGRRFDLAHDEEDLALSALDSFFAVIQRAEDDRARDRRSLWALLHQIIRRKVCDRLSRRRPPASIAMEAADPVDLRLPGPETLAELRELLESCLGILDDANRQIAALHLDGHSLSEIAERVGRSKSTVGLRLQEIYKTWQRRFGGEAA